MKRIINLTQHNPTPEQIGSGVIVNSAEQQALISELLTFSELPDRYELRRRAEQLAELAMGLGAVHETRFFMIGGAPFFMFPLVCALESEKLYPVYSFSLRVSEEQAQPDGSVKKVNVFKHLGFVE